jgi:hypothetical protein
MLRRDPLAHAQLALLDHRGHEHGLDSIRVEREHVLELRDIESAAGDGHVCKRARDNHQPVGLLERLEHNGHESLERSAQGWGPCN